MSGFPFVACIACPMRDTAWLAKNWMKRGNLSPTTRLRGPALALFWCFALGLVVIDLFSKAWVFSLTAEGPVFVAGNWLVLHQTTNPGGIFGWGQGLTVPLTFLRLVAVAVLIALVFRQNPQNRRGLFVLALLFGGAMGNLWDNLSRWLPWSGNGEVRDFLRLDLGFWPFHPWPSFNFADACISVSFVLLISGLAKIELSSNPADSC